ncbi:MAG: hypothetical protein BWY70_01224 [Bacteroidetes bacterium ADurb.Bin408]|nr:MAG: hypothetical protein BWY70_01224 [Bacteroidetes bacterium ADurb.Bin408]
MRFRKLLAKSWREDFIIFPNGIRTSNIDKRLLMKLYVSALSEKVFNYIQQNVYFFTPSPYLAGLSSRLSPYFLKRGQIIFC